MELDNYSNKIIRAFLQDHLDEITFDQLSKAKISAIEKTPFGLFADLKTTSTLISNYDGASPEFSIIKTIINPTSVGDAMLHSNNGVLQYLEIQFYDDEGWGTMERHELKD